MQSVGALSGPFLYVGTESFPGTVVKVNLSTFSVVDSLELNFGEYLITSMCTDGTYLYVILDTSPARVVRIRLSTFTRVDHLDFATDHDSGLCCDIISVNIPEYKLVGDYLFVGLGTIPGKIGVVDIQNFTYLGAIELGPGNDKVYCLTYDANYIYATLQPVIASSRVAKVDRSTFETVDSISLGYNYVRTPQSSEIVEDKLYVATWNSHAHLVKVDLPSFTVEDALNDGVTTTMVALKIVGDYLYLTDENVIKIALSTFSEVDRVSGFHKIVSLAYGKGFLYAGESYSPATIHKINLSPFSVVDSLTLAELFRDVIYLVYSETG